MRIIALCTLLIFVTLSRLDAQMELDPGLGGAAHFDMTGFPQWGRDLRRASIIAFGAFPFMYLGTHWLVDGYRYIERGFDQRYAPWPFASAGGSGHDDASRFRILGLAIAASMTVAVIDFGIERSRRNREARQAQIFGPGDPIIIRTPLYGDEEPADAETDES